MNIQYAPVYMYNHALIHILVMNMCCCGIRQWTPPPPSHDSVFKIIKCLPSIYISVENLCMHSLNKIENGNKLYRFNLYVKSFQLGAASIHEHDIEKSSQHPRKR